MPAGADEGPCVYRPDQSNRPLRRSVQLKDIFTNCPQRFALHCAGEVAACAEKDNGLLGVILSAIAFEQINFLCCIYDEFYPDDDVRTAFKVLVQRRKLTEVLDWRKDACRERVCLVYAGVLAGRGK